MSTEQEIAKHEQTLRLFKRRAEAIFECELARRDDADRLGQQMHVTFSLDKTTGQTSLAEIRMLVPPKEQVAYALTLIRPLTLTKKGDRLAWVTVLAALEQFCAADSREMRNRIEDLRKAWKAYPARRVRIMQEPIDPSNGPSVDAWDNEIARAFLYGDLVHGDDKAELLDALGDDEVVFAASAMASDGFRLINNTYQVMHFVRPDIAPENAYFTQKIMDTKLSSGGDAAVTPVDTEAERLQ